MKEIQEEMELPRGRPKRRWAEDVKADIEQRRNNREPTEDK